MRKLSLVIAVAVALAVPAVARAGFILEASLGRGWQVSPSIDDSAGPWNVMVAPGYGLGEMIRAELGFVIDMPNDGAETNLRLRPMLVIDPPIIPIYGRLIFGVGNLLEGDRSIEFGGALGVGVSLLGVGIFAEGGVIPQRVGGATATIIEARAGGFYAF